MAPTLPPLPCAPRRTALRRPGGAAAQIVALVVGAMAAACGGGSSDGKNPGDTVLHSNGDGSGDADQAGAGADGSDAGASVDAADSAGTGDDGAAAETIGPADDATGTSDPCPGSPGCPCDDTAPCAPDDDACTADPACIDGFCTGPEPLVCDDANQCTHEACVAGTGCVVTAAPGPCDDGDWCSYADQCEGTACKAGVPLPCDDGNACSDDLCAAKVGCTYSHNAAPCQDENACREQGVCALGGCVAGKVKPCSDGNACTYDRCSPETGCLTPPWPTTTACPAGADHGGWCYFALDHAEAVTFTAARAACAAAGGMLAVLPSKPAEDVARAVAATACGAKPAWIGLDDRIGEGIWRWADGGTMTWQHWNPGEPNNSGGEDVVELIPQGGWNDLGSAAARGCTLCAARIGPAACSQGACEPIGACSGGACAAPAAATAVSCDDANACTQDACAAKTGCSHVDLPAGASCTLLASASAGSFAGTCDAGVCVAAAASAGSASCAALAAAHPGIGGGAVTLVGADGAPWQSVCEQGADGGGWTLVARVAGKDLAWAFDGDGWKGTTAQGNPLGDATTSARLAGFAALSFTAVRLETRVDGVRRALVLPLAAPSLHALVQGTAPHASALGVNAWKSWIPKAALQPSCHVEGALPHLTPGVGGPKVRLGILGNNEMDCKTVDSWIGVGGDPASCGKAGVVAGNVACYGANAKIDATVWIYVR